MKKNLSNLLKRKEMSIIVSLPDNQMDLVNAAIEAKADALKFHINVSHYASGNKFKGLGFYQKIFAEVRKKFKGPIGIVFGDDIERSYQVNSKELRKVGFDYYSLFMKDIPSKHLLQNNLENTVAVNDQFNIEDLRAIESFNIKGIELAIMSRKDYGKRLNLEDMLKYRKYRQNTTLPLIVPSQKKILPEDLVLLNKLGMNAVMLGAVSIGKTPESIYNNVYKIHKELRKINYST